MSRSEIASSLIVKAEEVPLELINMKNLTLGPLCQKCDRVCKCPVNRKSRVSQYPFFWKGSNCTIRKSKTSIARRKKDGILAPSALKFIVAGSRQTNTEATASLPLKNESTTLPKSQDKEPSSSTCQCDRLSHELCFPVAETSSFTACNLPDFNSLSLKERNSASVNSSFPKLSHTYRNQHKSLRWRRKLKLSMKDLRKVLPTIPEDEEHSMQLLHSTRPDNLIGVSQNSDGSPSSCSQQALMETVNDDITINELASYLDEFVYIPKKMSQMAEMMYT